MKNEYLRGLVENVMSNLLNEAWGRRTKKGATGGGNDVDFFYGKEGAIDRQIDYQDNTDNGYVEMDYQNALPGNAYRKHEYISASNYALDSNAERQAKGLPYNKDKVNLYWSDEYRTPNGEPHDVFNGKSPYGRVELTYKHIAHPNYYNYPICFITLLNIDRQDARHFFDKYIKYTYNTGTVDCDSRVIVQMKIPDTRINFDKDGITFIVRASRIDIFKRDIWSYIIQYLDERGYFKNEQEKQNLTAYLNQSIPNGEELSEYFSSAAQNTIDFFNSFIEAENDEQIESYARMFEGTGAFDAVCEAYSLDKSFGHIFSLHNAMIIYGSMRKNSKGNRPTFLLTKNEWRRVYGRVVKPDAVPYHIYAPITYNKVKEGKAPKNKDLFQEIVETYFFDKTYKELTWQQKKEVNVLMNGLKTAAFYICTEFDVEDTVLVDESHDRFNEEVGLSNNITGTLNVNAVNYLRKMKELSIAANVRDEVLQPEEGITEETTKKNKVVNFYLNDFCKKYNIDYTRTNSIERNVINASVEIMYRMCEIRGVKPKTKREIFARTVVLAVCRLSQVALGALEKERKNLLKMCKGKQKVFTQNDSSIMYELCDALQSVMLGKHCSKKPKESNQNGGNNPRRVALEESVDNNNERITPLEFKNALIELGFQIEDGGMAERMNEAISTFNKVLGEMESSKYNLLK